jgi:hypothetical protein
MRGVRLSRERIRPQATSATNDRSHCAYANHWGAACDFPKAAIRAVQDSIRRHLSSSARNVQVARALMA